MSDIIYVYCGLDLHEQMIKSSIATIMEDRKDIDIGVATFGNKDLPPSIKLKDFCKKNNFLFYDSPRQDFYPEKIVQRGMDIVAHVDACELTGMLDISIHFYKNYDYKSVILMHPDTLSIDSADNPIEKLIDTDYCVTAPLVDFRNSRKKIDPKNLANLDGYQISKTSYRITQSILSFGRKFCIDLIEELNSVENIWNKYFKNSIKFGDCSLVELFPEFRGFDSILIQEEGIVTQETFKYHLKDNLSFKEYIKQNQSLKFLHVGHPECSGYDSYDGETRRERYFNYLLDIRNSVKRETIK